ncbi:MAG: zinc ribbon domain-containing protein [Burkholderiaceae bacterium]|nr:zinc ribbon domain-containing protein [Burkholderiaceae bacterium]
MPIYAYKCSACGHAEDKLQKISDAPLTVCPQCGQSTYSKQVTAAGFQLKGSGWYVTDFRSNGSGGAKTSEAAVPVAGSEAAAGGSAASGGDAKAGSSDASGSQSGASSDSSGSKPASGSSNSTSNSNAASSSGSGAASSGSSGSSSSGGSSNNSSGNT